MVLVELRQDFEVVFLLLQLRVLFSVLYQLRFQKVQVLFLFRVDQLQRLYLLRKLLVHFLVLLSLKYEGKENVVSYGEGIDKVKVLEHVS